jgi:hypothetical protein
MSMANEVIRKDGMKHSSFARRSRSMDPRPLYSDIMAKSSDGSMREKRNIWFAGGRM